MKRFRLSKAADADLRHIADYTQQHWGIEQRNAYIKEVFDAFARLSKTPEIAIKMDHIRNGYRKFPQGSHVIFFREEETHGIEIIRILHKRMDAEEQLT